MEQKKSGYGSRDHQENTSRFGHEEQTFRSEQDFTNRPPEVYGRPVSARLAALRRQGGVQDNTSTHPITSSQERNSINTPSIPEISPHISPDFYFADTSINQQNTQTSYNLLPNFPSSSEQIHPSPEMAPFQYRQITFQELLESGRTSDITSASSSTSHEARGISNSFRNTESSWETQQRETNESPLSTEDRHFLENIPTYPIRELTTNKIIEFSRGEGSPLSPYAVYDLQDPTGTSSLRFINHPSELSLYPEKRYALFNQNPASYDPYQLLSPHEALRYFRKREKQTQEIAQTQHIHSQISSLDISQTSTLLIPDIQNIDEQRRSEFELLYQQEVRNHADPEDNGNQSHNNGFPSTESCYGASQTHSEKSTSASNFDIQDYNLEEGDNQLKPVYKGPLPNQITISGSSYQRVHVSGNGYDCATRAALVSAGYQQDHTQFEEIVNYTRQYLTDRRLIHPGQMLNLGLASGRTMISQLRFVRLPDSTPNGIPLLDPNRPVEVVTLDPTTGQPRSVLAVESQGNGEPLRVFLDEAREHFSGMVPSQDQEVPEKILNDPYKANLITLEEIVDAPPIGWEPVEDHQTNSASISPTKRRTENPSNTGEIKQNKRQKQQKRISNRVNQEENRRTTKNMFGSEEIGTPSNEGNGPTDARFIMNSREVKIRPSRWKRDQLNKQTQRWNLASWQKLMNQNESGNDLDQTLSKRSSNPSYDGQHFYAIDGSPPENNDRPSHQESTSQTQLSLEDTISSTKRQKNTSKRGRKSQDDIRGSIPIRVKSPARGRPDVERGRHILPWDKSTKVLASNINKGRDPDNQLKEHHIVDIRRGKIERTRTGWEVDEVDKESLPEERQKKIQRQQQYKQDRKEKTNQYNQQYYQDKKEGIKQYHQDRKKDVKQYYQDKKEGIRQQQQEYYQNNKNIICIKKRIKRKIALIWKLFDNTLNIQKPKKIQENNKKIYKANQDLKTLASKLKVLKDQKNQEKNTISPIHTQDLPPEDRAEANTIQDTISIPQTWHSFLNSLESDEELSNQVQEVENQLQALAEMQKSNNQANTDTEPHNITQSISTSERTENQDKDKKRSLNKTRITYDRDGAIFHPSQAAYEAGVKTSKIDLPRPRNRNESHHDLDQTYPQYSFPDQHDPPQASHHQDHNIWNHPNIEELMELYLNLEEADDDEQNPTSTGSTRTNPD